MATLKLTIFKAKVLKDGRHKIRVAVCHKQETCYIVTRFIIDNLSQFKNGQVIKRPDAAMINTKLRNLLNEYQERLDNIKCTSMYDCKQLREMIIHGSSKIQATFQEVSIKYATILRKEGRDNYAMLFDRNVKYFTEYTKGDFLLSDITPYIIKNYEIFLKKEKKLGDTSVGMFIARTKVITNYAKRENIAKFETSPFEFCKIQASQGRELNLSPNNFNKIRTSTFKEKKLKVSRDLFCLSFYLGGINLIDLLSIDFKNKDYTECTRTKSKNTKQEDKRTVIALTFDSF